MKIKAGNVGFHIAFKVPNGDTERMELFFETHEAFMRETHYIEGTVEPIVLCYAVMKSPEFNDPLDSTSGETGHTLYGITEIYNGPEGAQMHMQLGQQRAAMFMELVDLTSKYCISGIIGAAVMRSM
tara:strand:- start:777 stop:1157 length:381 start_codon:yes stop_codon:yes gene_type:complete